MRQIILNITEVPGGGAQIHAVYSGHREDETQLEHKVGDVIAGMIRTLVTSMEPTDIGEGATTAEAKFSLDISKDIKKAGGR